MTLRLNGRYAGRFAIGLGRDLRLEGDFVVASKAPGPQSSGTADPNSPLGKCWLGLAPSNRPRRAKRHGHCRRDPHSRYQRPGQPPPQRRPRGRILLGERDIEDLHSILSVGSRVVIQKQGLVAAGGSPPGRRQIDRRLPFHVPRPFPSLPQGGIGEQKTVGSSLRGLPPRLLIPSPQPLPMYAKQALIDLVRQKALKFGNFTLASGKKATYYLDGKC